MLDIFEKRKKIENNPFGDKDYTMKERYNADDLLVARFKRISSSISGFGPMTEETDQKYIFEKIEEESNIKYREIFTGYITEDFDMTIKNNRDIKHFNLPYVIKAEKLTDYLPHTSGINLPKLSLIWILNDINQKNKVISLNK